MPSIDINGTQPTIIYVILNAPEIIHIPSHVGISENDHVDEAAKEATKCLYYNLPCTHNDLKRYLHKRNKEYWNNKWIQSSPAKITEIRKHIFENPQPHLKSRRYQVILTRLRIDHCRLTHEHLMTKNQPEICSHCNIPITVKHLLIDCPSYQSSRVKFNIPDNLKQALCDEQKANDTTTPLNSLDSSVENHVKCQRNRIIIKEAIESLIVLYFINYDPIMSNFRLFSPGERKESIGFLGSPECRALKPLEKRSSEKSEYGVNLGYSSSESEKSPSLCDSPRSVEDGETSEGSIDIQPNSNTNIENIQEKEEATTSDALPQNILDALGKRLEPDRPLGPSIHKDISIRWIEITTKDLPREEQEMLVKKYPIPENCKEINAPILNPEIKASLPEGAINRDTRMVAKQTKLSSCLAALGAGISGLLNSGGSDHLPMLETLCDVGRLLVDLQREESLTRKSLILPNINISIREALKATTINEYLFGQELEGHIKTAKSLERTRPDPSFNTENSTQNDGRAQETLQPPADGMSQTEHEFSFGTRAEDSEETLETVVLQWILGYKIPFASRPWQNIISKEPLWSNRELVQVSECLNLLLLKGVVGRCKPLVNQFISGIFLISKPDGSSRLILNLKQVNKFIKTSHFKLEDLRTSSDLMFQNCFMATLDLKEAYYLIPIAESSKKFLRFNFQGKLFEFNCLPFGLNTAPYVFTKLMRPVISYLRKQDITSVIYLDDILLVGDLCQWCKIHSERMTIRLPQDKENSLLEYTDKFINKEECKIRELASLIDASLSGWGAYCNNKTAHGFWQKEERNQHINYLELLAAFFSLKCFATDLKDCNILLKIDNTTAISYINRMGGIQFKVLSKLSKEIWKCCESRNIWIFASYVRSRENVIADIESRRLEPETEFEFRSNTKCHKYVSWRKDPESIAIDAFTIEWLPWFFYAFPPFAIILKVLRKIRSEGARGIIVVPYWPSQVWFPLCMAMFESKPIILSPNFNLLRSRNREPHPLWPQLSLVTGISSNKPLKKWWNFCNEQAENMFTLNIPNILRFLTVEYNNGATYGTINSYRSALALLQGPEVGQNPCIKRFCKGVANVRPPRPKYNDIWEPKAVLDFLDQWQEDDKLTLEDLSKKLVTLLALITGQRMQTLSLINVMDINKLDNRIEIKIPASVKTSGPQRKQPTLVLPYYTLNKKLCAASALETYLERTQQLRKDITYLFISYKKPFKAVSSQSLSRWIKNILEKSGINTNVFTAYSTRHAATSAANRSGINIDLIRKTAGWTAKSKAFANFYNLKITDDNTVFANSVLKRQK
ncbi:uncharacterized protein LOC143180473 [Calliopsis andreniformis]|uniref:uncharacterized protein LOC143180473 n=1 Tax=Calliopsis andreniformis TaxID=337506 RepID=UPI003FCD39A3